jgi:hypothetical protein
VSLAATSAYLASFQNFKTILAHSGTSSWLGQTRNHWESLIGSPALYGKSTFEVNFASWDHLNFKPVEFKCLLGEHRLEGCRMIENDLKNPV